MNRINRTIEEFKKITWVSPKECLKNIGYVIGFSTGMGLFLFAVSFVFGEASSLIMGLVK